MNVAKQGLTIAAVALDAIELIDRLLHAGGPEAALIASLKALVVSLRDGIAGKTSPQVVIAHLEALQLKLAENDTAADAELRERFPQP